MKAPVVLAALLFSAPALAQYPGIDRIPVPTPRPFHLPTQNIPVPTPRPTDNIPIPTPRPMELIRCSFTEPFFTVEWNEATGKVKTVEADEVEWDENGNVIDDHAVIKEGFAKIRTGENTFDIRNAKGEVAVKLTLDFDGNDGMSDTITPYTGLFGSSLYGGCSSNYYKDKTLE
jgi:hypothetical protein